MHKFLFIMFLKTCKTNSNSNLVVVFCLFKGRRTEFILSHIGMSALMGILGGTAQIEVFFVLSLFGGFIRSTCMSIPFDIANDLIKDTVRIDQINI